MTNYKKANLSLSILCILLFTIPIFTFRGNITLSMFEIVVYYSVVNIWFVSPSIVSMLVYAKGNYEDKTFDILMVILNIVALFWLFPVFKMYVFWNY